MKEFSKGKSGVRLGWAIAAVVAAGAVVAGRPRTAAAATLDAQLTSVVSFVRFNGPSASDDTGTLKLIETLSPVSRVLWPAAGADRKWSVTAPGPIVVGVDRQVFGWGDADRLYVRIEYFDEGTTGFYVQYQQVGKKTCDTASTDGLVGTREVVCRDDSGAWRSVTLVLDSGRLADYFAAGADFRIALWSGASPVHIHEISISPKPFAMPYSASITAGPTCAENVEDGVHRRDAQSFISDWWNFKSLNGIVGGRPAVTSWEESHGYGSGLLFSVDHSYAYGPVERSYLTIEYWDEGTGTIQAGGYQVCPPWTAGAPPAVFGWYPAIVKKNTRTWKTATVVTNPVDLRSGIARGPDFQLTMEPGTWIRRISYEIGDPPPIFDGIAAIKQSGEGAYGRVSGVVTRWLGGDPLLAMESRDRTCGILVKYAPAEGGPTLFSPGDEVSVVGTVTRGAQGKVLQLDRPPIRTWSGDPIGPLGTNLASVVGPGLGLDGLFVRVWGRVRSVDPGGNPSFTIDDGSAAGPVSVYTWGRVPLPQPGSFVVLNAVVGGDAPPQLYLWYPDDILLTAAP